MGKLPKATSRRDLIARFRELGWEGPFKREGRKRGKHAEFMRKGTRTVMLPNEHGEDIREPLLKKIVVRQAGLTVEEWTGDDRTEADPDQRKRSTDDYRPGGDKAGSD